jgi:hypothetical protein
MLNINKYFFSKYNLQNYQNINLPTLFIFDKDISYDIQYFKEHTGEKYLFIKDIDENAIKNINISGVKEIFVV